MRPSCSGAGLALALMLSALGSQLPGDAAEPEPAPAAAVRAALEQWTADFNAGNAGEICGLFAFDLRYDYRGQPERGYPDICNLLHRSLNDRSKQYAYALEIKEILVAGDFAIVRLVWTLGVRSNEAPGFVQSIESGMDIFRKQPDGSWKIIRYIAYEE
jgi:ketosteroid isomerase-like protein